MHIEASALELGLVASEDLPVALALRLLENPAQKPAFDALDIRRLAMVIGPSMGGMIAWEWAIEASDRVDLELSAYDPTRGRIVWRYR